MSEQDVTDLREALDKAGKINAGWRDEVERLTRERDEALDQRAHALAHASIALTAARARIAELELTASRVELYRNISNNHAHAAEAARARIAELERQVEMACQDPRDGCDCPGCQAADAHYGHDRGES